MTSTESNNQKRRKPVRLEDIAKEANVSKATVAKVLTRCDGNIRVSEARRAMILEIAERLHYQPNLSAQTLSGRASKIIGVLMDSRSPGSTFRLLAHIEREAEKRGYRVMIGEAHNNIANLYENYRIFRQYSVDGVICLSHGYPGAEEEMYRYFHDVENIVFIGKVTLPFASYVNLDHESSIVEAFTHLYHTRGCRRIGLVTGRPEYESVKQRMRGLERGSQICGLPLDPSLIYALKDDANESFESQMHDVADNFLAQAHPDAILAPNDLCAAHLIRILTERGFRVPEDMPVVGHDNELFGGSFRPSLTTIDECPELVAGHATKMLFEILDGKNPDGAPCGVTVRTRLILRESA